MGPATVTVPDMLPNTHSGGVGILRVNIEKTLCSDHTELDWMNVDFTLKAWPTLRSISA